MYFSAPRWVTSRWWSSSIADILRLLAVKRLKATCATPKTDTVAFAVASRVGMSGYSYVSAELVDARMATHLARQPSSISGLSLTQHNTSPPVGDCSAHANVVTPSARSDANVSSSSAWTPVADWQVHPNFDLPGWVAVESAGNYSVVLQQTSSSASSTVFQESMLAQQAAMPSAFNMQRYVLATGRPKDPHQRTVQRSCEENYACLHYYGRRLLLCKWVHCTLWHSGGGS